MKKNFFRVAIISPLVLSLTACSLNPFKKAEETDPFESNVEVDEKKPLEDEGEEEVKDVELEGTEYSITFIRTMYKNNRAWVSYNDENDTKIALIDTDGKVLYSASCESAKYVNCQITDNSAYTCLGKCNYVIVDLDGNELYKTEKTDESVRHILASYNDKYLIWECTKTFDSDEQKIYLADSKGNKISEEYSDPEMIGDFDLYECDYFGDEQQSIHEYLELGNGISKINSDDYMVFVNYKTNKMYSMLKDSTGHLDYDFAQSFTNGKCIFTLFLGYGYDNKDFKLKPEDYSDKESLEKWMKNPTMETYFDIEMDADTDEVERACRKNFVQINEGVGVHINAENECQVIDANGQVLATKSFPEGTVIATDVLDPIFVDGYAYVEIKGQDDKRYFTLIDKNGTAAFEPALKPESETACGLNNGYVLFENHISTPQGKVLSLDDDLSGLSDLEVTGVYYDYEFGIRDGIVRAYGTPGEFHTLDKSKTINKVIVIK